MGTHPIFESDFDCLTDMGDFVRDLVGNGATCVTIIMFLCPFPTIGQINRQKKVPIGFNVYPYAFTAVLATLWWYYGAIIQDGPMIRVNAVGSIIETIYCLILFWRSEPYQVTRPLLSCLLFCIGTLIAVQLFDDIEDGKSFLGTINVVVNMATFATPLLSVKQVIRSKNCSSFPPLSLQIAMTLTPSLWTWYALIIHDSFLLIPNSLGIALGLFQLSLRLIYPSGPEPTKAEV